jgi:hypothetical protein
MTNPRLLTTVACLFVASIAHAQSCPPTLASLKKLSQCELDRLFEQAPPGEIPHGYARGQVLLKTDAHFPKLRARLDGAAWKGKHFDDHGDFINQWPGFTALRGQSQLGTSWHDEKPCLVLDYPPGTPLFGNTRDELRQIGPGLYLARLYETCPCPRFRGYFAIQVCAACP